MENVGEGCSIMRRLVVSTINSGVFRGSAVILMWFVLCSMFVTNNLSTVVSAVLGYLINTLGWVSILSVFGFLAWRDQAREGDERPEFRTVSWAAKLFNVGKGIDLMFLGMPTLQQSSVLDRDV